MIDFILTILYSTISIVGFYVALYQPTLKCIKFFSSPLFYTLKKIS